MRTDFQYSDGVPVRQSRTPIQFRGIVTPGVQSENAGKSVPEIRIFSGYSPASRACGRSIRLSLPSDALYNASESIR